MHLRNQDRLRERVQLDLDMGTIVKILMACLVVCGAIFWMGLVLGRGDLLPGFGQRPTESSIGAVLASLRGVQAAEAATPSPDESMMMFPTALARRADQSVDGDLVVRSLAMLRPVSLAQQERKEQEFRQDFLRARFGVEQDPETGAFHALSPAQIAALEPIPGVRMKTEVRLAAPGPEPTPLPPPPSAVDMAMDQMDAVARTSAEEEPAATQAPDAEEAGRADLAAAREAAAAGAAPSAVLGDVEPAKKNEAPRLGRYTLQLQSFQSPDEAQAFKTLMEKRGYHPFIQKARLGSKGVWHRVRVGRFVDMQSAQTFKEKFERDQGIVTKVMTLQ